MRSISQLILRIVLLIEGLPFALRLLEGQWGWYSMCGIHPQFGTMLRPNSRVFVPLCAVAFSPGGGLLFSFIALIATFFIWLRNRNRLANKTGLIYSAILFVTYAYWTFTDPILT